MDRIRSRVSGWTEGTRGRPRPRLRDPRGFDITAHFSEGLDWAGWNNRGIPSGFKGACADLSQAQNWMYYILDQGTLTGGGEYAGSALTLSHQPESEFYGTQVGEGGIPHPCSFA